MLMGVCIMTTRNWVKFTVLAGIVVGSGGLTTTAQAASDPTPTGNTSLQTTATVTVPEPAPETPTETASAAQDGTVTISYQTTTGKRLAPEKVLTGTVGHAYQVTQPKFSGYVLAKVEGTVEGEFTTTPGTVKLVYEPRRAATATPVVPTKRTASTSVPAKSTEPTEATTRTATPRNETATRDVATPRETTTRTTSPTKGVEVLGKYPVHREASATQRLPQTGEAATDAFLPLMGSFLLLTTLGGAGILKRRDSTLD